jgi:integrase
VIFANPAHISLAHGKAVKALGIRKECTLYSWKHTAGVKLYDATKDPYLIMKFFRHSTLQMTMIYLKSLGMDTDDRLKEVRF